MTYEKIINTFKRTPLTDAEIEILQQNDYRFNAYTPERIKSNMEMILYMLENDPSCVDLYDSCISKAIKNSDTYNLHKLFKFLDEQCIPYDHLPHAALYNIATGYRNVEEVFSCLVICRNLKNCNHRTTDFDSIKLMSHVAWNWEYALWDDDEKDIVIRALISNKIPASVLPDLLLIDPKVIKAYTAKMAPYTQECILRALTEEEITALKDR